MEAGGNETEVGVAGEQGGAEVGAGVRGSDVLQGEELTQCQEGGRSIPEKAEA